VLVQGGAEFVVHDQQLVDAGAAAVAGVTAGRAAGAGLCVGQVRVGGSQRRALFGCQRHGLCAVVADAADQALGQHRLHGGRHQVGLDAQVDEAREGGGGVIGVQRGQHQVAGERCVGGDVGGVVVADLAD